MRLASGFGSALLIAATISFTSCSKPTGPKPVDVSGKVTLDGKALPNVTISFTALDKTVPVKNRYVAGTTDAEGSYSLKNVHQGEHLVQIQETGAAAVDPTNPAVAGAYPGNPKLAYYGSNSPLRVKVSDTAKTFDFTLPQAQ